MPNELYTLADTLGNRLKDLNLTLSLAESCTGGGIAKAVTDVPGSSRWFDRGFVTYSNAAKIEMLGVKPSTVDSAGAVSIETALEMAAGALIHSHADLTLAVTGIAGPDGGRDDKPVGTVFIAWQRRNQPAHGIRHHFDGNRETIRYQVTLFCLRQTLNLLSD